MEGVREWRWSLDPVVAVEEEGVAVVVGTAEEFLVEGGLGEDLGVVDIRKSGCSSYSSSESSGSDSSSPVWDTLLAPFLSSLLTLPNMLHFLTTFLCLWFGRVVT